MIPDYILIPCFVVLGLFCLCIIGIPVLLASYYRPELDETLLVIIEKSYRIFYILVFIAILILGGIWNNIDIPTIIKMWPVLLILLCVPIYFCYRQLYTLVNPLTEEQQNDPHLRELDLILSYNKAFRLCKTTIDMLGATEYTDNITIDPDSGTISFELCPQYYLRGFLMWPTLITISLKKRDAATTHVKIFAITPIPLKQKFHGDIIPSGLNEGYVNRIAGYLLGKNPGEENDNSPPVINA